MKLEPKILHLSCHGVDSIDEETNKTEKYLLFEKETGEAEYMKPEHLEK